MDMTDAEQAIMREHALYWHALAKEDVAVVFGPIGDPAGPWGLGILRAESDAAAHALEAGDPAIRANVGFRYELLPFLRTVRSPS